MDGNTIELKLLDRKFERDVVKALVQAYTQSNSDVVSVLYGPRPDYNYADEFAATCATLVKNDLKAARRGKPVLSAMALDKASQKVLAVAVGNDWNDPLLDDEEDDLREEVEDEIFEELYEAALKDNKSIRWLERAPAKKAFLMFLGGTVPSAQQKGIFSALAGALIKYANEVVGFEYAVAIGNNAATNHMLEDKEFQLMSEIYWAGVVSDIVKDGCDDDDDDDSYLTLEELAATRNSAVVDKNPTTGLYIAQIEAIKSNL